MMMIMMIMIMMVMMMMTTINSFACSMNISGAKQMITLMSICYECCNAVLFMFIRKSSFVVYGRFVHVVLTGLGKFCDLKGRNM